jgi:hypothetical protein
LVKYTITTTTIRLQGHVAQPKSKERKKRRQRSSLSPSHVSMLSIPRILKAKGKKRREASIFH